MYQSYSFKKSPPFPGKKEKKPEKDHYTIVCHFDGACWPKNPYGHMGMGGFILYEGANVYEFYYGIEKGDTNSNNVAEYLALKGLLDKLIELGHNRRSILIKGDSNLVIMQMMGLWKIKSGMYAEHAKYCKSLLPEFSDIHFQWIPREKNEDADYLSNLGVDQVCER